MRQIVPRGTFFFREMRFLSLFVPRGTICGFRLKIMHQNRFDILVIGGGHAGIEASIAAAKMGMHVGLVSMDINTIGRLSCNPSIGGSAKGHLATEIDALGGVMPQIGDASGLQFKILNSSKGPAVWSPRSQNDKDLYPLYAQNVLLKQKNLTIISETVTEVLVTADSKVRGVRTLANEEILAKAVILCSGTFLNAVMWTGMASTEGGRVGEQPSHKISDLLDSYGLRRGRLKTGTPPRIHAKSIDYGPLEPHNGDKNPRPLSINTRTVRNRLACFATQTTTETHERLRGGFSQSPMFTGMIKGAGPRYCPSIEDKVHRFSDKPSHPIVLEPEGLFTDTVYVNGYSTSLPRETQDEGIRTIPGLKNAKILRYGYAVEYDFFFPYQLTFGLETKAISGLFFAGQINGTSGYEEAAAQGLIAGINAARKIKGEDPLSLQRSQAYIGVMIDDLVNKNTEEPYRIFTSLAEYRLLLRIDTAYSRLLPLGVELGLVSEHTASLHYRTLEVQDSIQKFASETKISPPMVNEYLSSIEEDHIPETTTVRTIAKRPRAELRELLSIAQYPMPTLLTEHPSAIHAVETEIRYEGYIAKQQRDVERFIGQELQQIPPTFSYDNVRSLSAEAREKLMRIRPASLGQASRIPGVSASDVSILALFLR